MERSTCKACRHWKPDGNSHEAVIGTCRATPPLKDDGFVGRWLSVAADEWCIKFRLKKGVCLATPSLTGKRPPIHSNAELVAIFSKFILGDGNAKGFAQLMGLASGRTGMTRSTFFDALNKRLVPAGLVVKNRGKYHIPVPQQGAASNAAQMVPTTNEVEFED